MAFNYLLIYSKALKATIKEIRGKNSKSATHRPGGGGGGGVVNTDRDSLHMVSCDLPILQF